MPVPIPPEETRSPDQLRAQYELERQLSAELLKAGLEERPRLYAEAYRRLREHQLAEGTLAEDPTSGPEDPALILLPRRS